MALEEANDYPETEKLIKEAHRVARKVKRELKEIQHQLRLINLELDKYEAFLNGPLGEIKE